MNFKNKLANIALEKLKDQVLTKDSIDGTINSLLNKLGETTGQKPAETYIQEITKKYLIIKSKSYSLGTMVGLFSGKIPNLDDHLGRYQIIDKSGVIKYKSDAENTITNKENLNLYDSNGKKVGYVKEHLMSVGIPLLEKEVKKCSIYLGKDKIAVLKKSESFGDITFEVLEGDVKITHTEGQKFKIYYKDNLIAALHDIPLNLRDGYADKFVMEYDSVEDETIGVLLATAIDLINT